MPDTSLEITTSRAPGQQDDSRLTDIMWDLETMVIRGDSLLRAPLAGFTGAIREFASMCKEQELEVNMVSFAVTAPLSAGKVDAVFDLLGTEEGLQGVNRFVVSGVRIKKSEEGEEENPVVEYVMQIATRARGLEAPTSFFYSTTVHFPGHLCGFIPDTFVRADMMRVTRFPGQAQIRAAAAARREAGARPSTATAA